MDPHGTAIILPARPPAAQHPGDAAATPASGSAANSAQNDSTRRSDLSKVPSRSTTSGRSSSRAETAALAGVIDRPARRSPSSTASGSPARDSPAAGAGDI